MSKNAGFKTDFDWQWIESNFKSYGLKVRLKSEDTKILIDVGSSINSDQHYIQQASNYLYDQYSNKITGCYNISSYQLFGILATAAEIEITTLTSDAFFLTNSWWITYIWLRHSDIDKYSFILKSFKEKYPYCKEIELTTCNLQVYINVKDEGEVEDFNQLQIRIDTIDLSGVTIELAEQV